MLALPILISLGKVLYVNCTCFMNSPDVARIHHLQHYSQEALHLLEEGALPQQVDDALMKFGMALGPFGMSDLAGTRVDAFPPN